MNEDLEALIDSALSKEKELATRADELALQSKQFADYLQAKKHADEELEVLWSMVKDFMVENGYTDYDGEHIKLKLTPSGKYRADDLDMVDDSLCDIKRTLSNKKVKAYVELNGALPVGIEPTGYVLRKTLK